MLPVALTSPLWWVTRWSSRLLTSFAVAVALSLGGSAPGDGVALAATVPLGAAPPAVAAAPLAAVSPAHVSGGRTALGPGTVAHDAARRNAVGHDTAIRDAVGWPQRPVAAEPADRPAGAVGASTAALAGLTPTVVGPRAPPVC